MENTALVQGIMCEPLGEHFIPWTRAVFFHPVRKCTPFVFFTRLLKLSTAQRSVGLQLADMTDDHKVVNRRRSVISLQ